EVGGGKSERGASAAEGFSDFRLPTSDFPATSTGATPVGISSPSTKTVRFVPLPVWPGSSITRILSNAAWPGAIIGYIALLATHRRPCASQLHSVGLARSGFSAQRVISSPSARVKVGSGSVEGEAAILERSGVS